MAIIVSSRPAFAAFAKDKMPHSTWLSTLRSRFFKSKYSDSRSKIGVSQKPSLGVPSSQESILPDSHPRANDYLELQDTRHRRDYELGSVRTEIQGMRASPGTVQEGVVHKSIAVHQSMDLNRPVAQI